MDPFIILKYGKVKYKTKVLDKAGVNPEWNQEFTIPIGSEQDSLNIFCYDEDFIIDDFIGLTTMKFQEIEGLRADASPEEYHP
jgi:Ca2+-dependent lipid-binding protein